jgi:hypothetical protein
MTSVTVLTFNLSTMEWTHSTEYLHHQSPHVTPKESDEDDEDDEEMEEDDEDEDEDDEEMEDVHNNEICMTEEELLIKYGFLSPTTESTMIANSDSDDDSDEDSDEYGL